MKTVINIAFAFDKNYWTQFCAVVHSVLTSQTSVVHLHLIAPDTTIEQKTALKEYVKEYRGEVNFYDVTRELVDGFVVMNKWSHAVYYKLFFPLLVAGRVERLLYIDVDTIVLNPLDELFKTDLKGHSIGAVYDNYVKQQPLIGVSEGEYFNSGVMLIDVESWNSKQVSQKSADYLRDFPDRIRFVDQCALNAVLKHDWYRLSFHYNLLYSYLPDTYAVPKSAYLRDKYIIHFTLQRPWEFLTQNRFSYLYRRNVNQTPLLSRRFKYQDFTFSKIPAYLKTRLHFFYSESPMLQMLRRSLKMS